MGIRENHTVMVATTAEYLYVQWHEIDHVFCHQYTIFAQGIGKQIGIGHRFQPGIAADRLNIMLSPFTELTGDFGREVFVQEEPQRAAARCCRQAVSA